MGNVTCVDDLIFKYGNLSDKVSLAGNGLYPLGIFFFYIFAILLVCLIVRIILFKINRSEKFYIDIKGGVFIGIPFLLIMMAISFYLYHSDKKSYEENTHIVVENIAKRITPDGYLINRDGDKVKNEADIAAIKKLAASYHEADKK